LALLVLCLAAWNLGMLMLRSSSASEAAVLWLRLSLLGALLFLCSFLLFAHAFLTSPPSRRIVTAYMTGGSLLAVTTLATPWVIASASAGPEGWTAQPGPLFFPLSALLVLPGYGMFMLFRARNASRDVRQRNRISYIIFGLYAFLIGILIDTLSLITAEHTPAGTMIGLLAVLCMTYAVVRSRLLDSVVIVRRGVALALVSAVVTGLYAGGLLLLRYIFSNSLQGIVYVSLTVTALLLLVFRPMREIVYRWVDRLFFPASHEARILLQDTGRAIGELPSLADLANLVLRRTVETLGASSGMLLAPEQPSGTFWPFATLGMGGDAERLRLRSDHPLLKHFARSGQILRSAEVSGAAGTDKLWPNERRDLEQLDCEVYQPLMAGQRIAGLLVLGPKNDGQPYTLADEATLSTLAGQVAVALENVRLAKEATEEKERTETIVNEVFAGILVVDPGLRIVMLNPHAQSIIGYDSDEIVGKRLSEVLGQELWGQDSSLSTVMRTGKRVADVETVVSAKSGARDILLAVTPLREGYLLSFSDITRLKEVSRLKSAIVADVSHEFRAPLATIKAYAQLLLANKDRDDPDLRHEFLTHIRQECDRLADMVSDFLDLSRLEAGHFEEEWERLPTSELIQEVASSLGVQADEKGVSLSIRVPVDLPHIVADRRLLTMIFRNLVGNAIKFSRDGGVVDVLARQEADCLVFDIVDQGIGIASHDLPHVFDKFYRMQSARDAGVGGTGLGLTLAKAAAEAHGGTITVESELGVGSRFTVNLPIKRAEEPNVVGS